MWVNPSHISECQPNVDAVRHLALIESVLWDHIFDIKFFRVSVDDSRLRTDTRM